MSAQHTKGPWRLQHLGNQEADLISGGTFMGLTGGSGAPEKYDAKDAAEWLANAQLVVTAPDLLSIAKRWAALDAGSWHVDRHAAEKAELLADTRAAIDKAELGSTQAAIRAMARDSTKAGG